MLHGTAVSVADDTPRWDTATRTPTVATPYATTASVYADAGWCPLPLPSGTKWPPPGGTTGHFGYPSRDQIDEWVRTRPDSNIGVRVPDGVIGIDVDAYDDKRGGDTLAAAERQYGPLPAAPRSTSRPDDPVSGIRFYRVPPGIRFRGQVGPDIEVVQPHHRYAVVWPSVHASGGTYRWYGCDGIPDVASLPDLPPQWVESLRDTAPRADADGKRSGATVPRPARDVPLSLPDGEPCPVMAQAITTATDAIDTAGSRYDAMVAGHYRLMCLGAEGHPGATVAVDAVSAHYATRLAEAPRDGVSDVHGEIARSIAGAAQRIPGTAVTEDPCITVPRDRAAAITELVGAVGSVADPVEPPARRDDDTTARVVRLTRADSTPPRAVEWMWDGRIAVGTLALLAGREGIGKSTLAYWLLARVTRGELPGAFRGTSRDVLIVATEDGWREVVIPRLMAAGADLTRVHHVDVVDTTAPDGENERELNLAVDRAELHRAAIRVHAALLLLDPLISRLGGNIDTHKDSSVRIALEPLTRMLNLTGMACIGIIHVSKAGHTEILDTVMGSKAFTAVSRSVHTVIRDDTGEEPRLIYGAAKNNYGPLLECQSFTVVSATVAKGITAPRIEWGEVVEGTIRDFHALSSEAPKKERNDKSLSAATWLEWYLGQQPSGEQARDVALKAAKLAGHAERTLERVVTEDPRFVKRSSGFPRRTVWASVAPTHP